MNPLIHPLVAFLVCLLTGINANAQTVIWSETFPDANGTNSDPSGEWTSSCTGCVFSNSSDFFEVRNNEFSGRDMDGLGVWTSRWVDISAFVNVSISVQLRDLGTLESTDSVSVSYSTDGGATFTRLVRGAYIDDFSGIQSAVAQDINADSIQIRILVRTNDDNDIYSFDNIYIIEPGTDLPGSGFCLDFDDAAGAEAGDVVELPSSFPYLPADDFTVAAWVNSDNVASAGQRIFCNDQNNTSNGYSLSLGDPGSGRIRFYMRNASPVSLDMSDATFYLTSNTWYHVAMVHDAATNARSIYINGELAANDTYTGSPSGAADGLAGIGGEVAASGESSNRFNGEIDEVSVWQTALSQTEIRNLMCAKLIGSEPNLLAYYRFDDGAGHTVRDEVGNYTGGTVNMDVTTDWVTSGAAIGDQSTYLHTTSWTGQTLQHVATGGDTLMVNSVAGSPRLVHIYYVNQLPNSTAGSSGVGDNTGYFGVFHAFGSSTNYTATYYYRENDAYQITGIGDATMVVYTRSNNAVASWSGSGGALNLLNKTITMTAVSTEFILGNSAVVLPVEFKSFTVTPNANSVTLNWECYTEINNDFFTLYKAVDDGYWVELDRVKGAGNSNVPTFYEFQDFDKSGKNHSVLYKLSQTDFDGTTNELAILRLKNEGEQAFSLYPNPTQDLLQLQGIETKAVIDIYGSSGNLLMRSEVDLPNAIDLSSLQSGVYLLRITTENGVGESHRILKVD